MLCPVHSSVPAHSVEYNHIESLANCIGALEHSTVEIFHLSGALLESFLKMNSGMDNIIN